jgi:hypothetical protein
MIAVGVPEQMAEQVPEQEALEQVAPEQGLPDPLTEGQVPETSQDMPELTTDTKNSMQSGLPNAVARGKSAATSLSTGLNQERREADAE